MAAEVVIQLREALEVQGVVELVVVRLQVLRVQMQHNFLVQVAVEVVKAHLLAEAVVQV